MFLRKYFQCIDTECNSDGTPGPFLKTKAVKLDGQGHSLKVALGVNSLKSCDYIKQSSNDKLCFIEVSNYMAQYRALMGRKNQLKSSLSAKELKMFDPRNVISQEIREKFIHSLLIVQKLKDEERIINPRKYFGLVVVCKASKTDLIALKSLSLKVEKSLRDFYEEIAIVPVSEVDYYLTI